jgi:hypothetical protein
MADYEIFELGDVVLQSAATQIFGKLDAKPFLQGGREAALGREKERA